MKNVWQCQSCPPVVGNKDNKFFKSYFFVMKKKYMRKILQHPQKYKIYNRFLVFFVKERFKIHLKTHFSTHISSPGTSSISAFEIPAKFEMAQHDWSKLKPRIHLALCTTPPFCDLKYIGKNRGNNDFNMF